jgi:hypothetical protein
MRLEADHSARRKRSNAPFLLPVLMVLAATTLGGPALAQKPIVLPEHVVPGPVGTAFAEGFRPWGAICQMGEPDTSTMVVDYVFSFPDRYFTFLRFNNCPTCVPPDSVLIKFAHVVMEFRMQCQMTLRVGVYGTRPFSGCTRPDTNVVLCPPRTVTIEPSGEGMFDLSAAVSSGCTIAQDAYLMIDFLGYAAPCGTNNRPRMVFSSQCPSCEQSYNTYFGGGSWFEDNLCDAQHFSGHRPTMYVEGDLCITPAVRQTWNGVKILYR